jgi:hypothetical protein
MTVQMQLQGLTGLLTAYLDGQQVPIVIARYDAVHQHTVEPCVLYILSYNQVLQKYLLSLLS